MVVGKSLLSCEEFHSRARPRHSSRGIAVVGHISRHTCNGRLRREAMNRHRGVGTKMNHNQHLDILICPIVDREMCNVES